MDRDHWALITAEKMRVSRGFAAHLGWWIEWSERRVWLALLVRLRAAGRAAVVGGVGPSILVLGRRDDLTVLAGELALSDPGFAGQVLAIDGGVTAT